MSVQVASDKQLHMKYLRFYDPENVLITSREQARLL